MYVHIHIHSYLQVYLYMCVKIKIYTCIYMHTFVLIYVYIPGDFPRYFDAIIVIDFDITDTSDKKIKKNAKLMHFTDIFDR
jgi:hypothetical protein